MSSARNRSPHRSIRVAYAAGSDASSSSDEPMSIDTVSCTDSPRQVISLSELTRNTPSFLFQAFDISHATRWGADPSSSSVDKSCLYVADVALIVINKQASRYMSIASRLFPTAAMSGNGESTACRAWSLRSALLHMTLTIRS